MAVDAKVLVIRARELAEVYQPYPELGIDWWDVPEYCPFHGSQSQGPCACMAEAEAPSLEQGDITAILYDLRDAKREADYGKSLW